MGQPARPFSLERSQEVDDLLLLLYAELIELFDDLVGLAATALMGSDGVHQVARPSVVEEEDALPDSPQGSGPELVGAGAALRDAIGQAFAHMMHDKVGEKIRRLIGKRSARTGRGATRNHFARSQRRRMAMDAADLGKVVASFFARRGGGSGSGRRQH